MVPTHTPLFGTAPWPTPLGNAWNTSVSPTMITARGTPQWSLPLPERACAGLTVAATGRCFVTMAHHLIAVDPPGGVAWRVTDEQFRGAAIVTADGNLWVNTLDTLEVRDQATGVLFARWPTHSFVSPGFTPTSDLLYTQFRRSPPHVLQRVSPSGTVRWEHPVADSSIMAPPPLVDDMLIVVGDRSYLRAFTLDGHVRWIANQEGFLTGGRSVDDATSVHDATSDYCITPVIRVDAQRVLAGLRWSRGHKYLIFDVQQHTVQPLGTHLPPHALQALVSVAGTPHLATIGLPVTTTHSERVPTIVLVSLDGVYRWQHTLPITPSDILADRVGHIVVACSPSFAYWEKYHQWYKLHEECFVRCYDSSGVTQWTWFAPSPLGGPLAVGALGEIYAVADGRLWALA